MGYNYPGDLLRPVNRSIENSSFIIDPNEYFKLVFYPNPNHDLIFAFRQCKNNSGMFQLLDLDYELDLDEMLNITSKSNEILERFDTIADALNQTTNGFLQKKHLDKLEAMKGIVEN